jgi:diphosphomevalonate decarboxylase
MNHLNYLINKAHVKVQSPSNIAFVKYWGKLNGQIPKNPSLSMTLSECRSETSIHFQKSGTFSILSFSFDKELNEQFRKKTEAKILSIIEHIPWLSSYSLKIESINTFPHSAGIASSASGFSAIIFALLKFESQLLKCDIDYKRASDLSRLCSGSASRSLFSGFAHWGESHFPECSNLHATPISYDLEFENTIAVVSTKVKDVSSTAGHSLMNSHPFADARYEMANLNLKKIDLALQKKDLAAFGEILENEALTLHSLMMSSMPSFILLEDKSLAIIKKVRIFREQTGEHLYFTIDAGPNIHLIYQKSDTIIKFINDDIKPLCDQLIFDRKGDGPKVLEESYE